MKGLRSLGLVPDFDKFILKSVSEMQIGINGIRIEFLGTGTGTGTGTGSKYCSYCGSHHCLHSNVNNVNNASNVSHAGTCSFLPDLRKKITAAVEEIKGLSLADFKRTEGKPTAANAAKWDIFDYK